MSADIPEPTIDSSTDPNAEVRRQVSGDEWIAALRDEREGAHYDARRNDPSDYGVHGSAIVAAADVETEEATAETVIDVQPKQGDLFVTDRTGRFTVSKDLLAPPVTELTLFTRETETKTIDPVRAVHVMDALRILSRMSRLTGLQNAADNPLTRRLIEDRMEVDKVMGRSDDMFRTLMGQARKAYEQAMGKHQLLEEGNDPDKVNAAADRAFSRFVQEFGDPKNQKVRTNTIDRLERRIKKARDADPDDFRVAKRPLGRTRRERPETSEDIFIDKDEVKRIDKWLTAVRLPVLEEMTGAYNIHPSVNGVVAYTGARHITDERLHDLVESEDPEVRQAFHKAESAEHYLGFIYALSYLRGKALTIALENIRETGTIETVSTARNAAGAIAEFGYCMTVPGNIPANRFKAIAEPIEQFGGRALKDPELLKTPEGMLLMEATLAEQNRRMDRVKPRYDAIVAFYGVQIPADKLDMDDIEALTISQLLVNKETTREKTPA